MITNRKFRKKLHLFLSILVVTFPALTGCSGILSSTDMTEELMTENENGEIIVGNLLAVKNTDDRLTLFSNMDALSSDGLYYASWTAGTPEAYENSDGETVDLYDAQLYLLLGEFKSHESAQGNMDNWLNAGQTNYDVSSVETVDCNGQPYHLILYDVINPENPYARGISAFGVHENTAVCIELTCQEDYTEDLYEMMIGFLDSCTYQK